MDFNTILQVIGSYGFPIVACCALAWYFNKINENYRNDLKELNANHKEEVKADGTNHGIREHDRT